MFETATLLVFMASAFLLALSPGPDNLFVLALSAVRGPIAGLVTTLGLCTGLIVHTAAVALGVAVVIRESATAFSILKICGALYLLWLAWKFIRSSPQSFETRSDNSHLRRLYLRGVLMNILNPKVSLFFLAFLPQFIDPAAGSLTLQIAILGLLFMLSALPVFGLISLTAGHLGARFQKGRGPRILSWLSATVFAALAVRLLLTEQ